MEYAPHLAKALGASLSLLYVRPTIIYAYSPKTNPLFATEQLRKLAAPLGANIKVLDILEEKPTSETIRKMEILEEAIRAREPRNISWSFDFQYAEDVLFDAIFHLPTE
jgi:hypothetical protein